MPMHFPIFLLEPHLWCGCLCRSLPWLTQHPIPMDGLESLHRAANALASTHSEAIASEKTAAIADRNLSKASP